MITYKDLSKFLKASMIGLWIVLGFSAIAFLVAFVAELI